jgi:hypothetical protein
MMNKIKGLMCKFKEIRGVLFKNQIKSLENNKRDFFWLNILKSRRLLCRNQNWISKSSTFLLLEGLLFLQGTFFAII